MRPGEKREFEAERLIHECIRKVKKDFGEKNVTSYKDDDGALIIKISSKDVKEMVRKEHQLPEYLREQGG